MQGLFFFCCKSPRKDGCFFYCLLFHVYASCVMASYFNYMKKMILLDHLSKSFKKKSKHYQVLKEISLIVANGEVFGFLGPNGAGKSTTIKLLLGFLKADSGTMRVGDIIVGQQEYRHLIGYLPELPFFYNHLTAMETLLMSGRLSGMEKKAIKPAAEQLLARLSLSHAAKQKVGSFSKGMKQRLGLANALIHNPPLLILDEPMSGLDPMGRHQVKQLIKELQQEGKTVFFSSHILSDIEELCDRIAVIHKGVKLYEGEVQEFVANGKPLEENFIELIVGQEEEREVV